jgi:hypothetical protein
VGYRGVAPAVSSGLANVVRELLRIEVQDRVDARGALRKLDKWAAGRLAAGEARQREDEARRTREEAPQGSPSRRARLASQEAARKYASVMCQQCGGRARESDWCEM